MTGQLITFPVRLYVRGARILIHAAEDVTGMAVINTLRVAGALSNLRPGAGGGSVPTPPPPARRPTPPAPPARRTSPTGPTSPSPDPRPARPNGSAPPAPAAPAAPPPDPTPVQPLADERLEREGTVAPVDLDTPTPIAPEHVSSEPVVVREESEPGAQDGAGAAITVQEPWDGYRVMNARDIVARVPTLNSAQLAAVQLYEGANRNRQTVIAAVARALAQKN